MSKLNVVVEDKNQLVQYLEDGCKPKSSWKIGTEHEKFGFIKSNLMPLPYKTRTNSVCNCFNLSQVSSYF